MMAAPRNTAAHTCPHCDKIIYDASQKQTLDAGRAKVPTIRVRVSETLEGAEDGCLLMQQLRDAQEKDGTFTGEASDYIELSFSTARHSNDQVSGISDITSARYSYFRYWITYVEPDDPSAKWISQREARRSLGDNDTLRLVAGWLKDCATSHSTCRPSQNHFSPLRLIDVGYSSSETVRLDDKSSHDSESYVALSYCWGGDQPAKTLRGNLASRLTAFSLTDQPKSIRDAVTVARSLGIRFLWVDSLCIVQDDEDDKLVEISRMHDIYRHAALTISAARARSSQEGFLDVCKPASPIRLGYRGPDGQLGSIIMSSTTTEPEPIHTRAWTLQEHLLSKRLLVFGSFGVRWVCGRGSKVDGVQENIRPHNIIAEYLLAQRLHSADVIEPELWSEVLVGYSARALTDKQDRLPAIAAFAAMYSAARPHDQYLAGLWKQTLLRDILWNVCVVDGKRDQHAGFPTWSWASVRGRLGLFTFRTSACNVYTAKVINCNVVLRSAITPFGQVERGILTVEGYLSYVQQTTGHTYTLLEPSRRPPGLFQDAVIHVARSSPPSAQEDNLSRTIAFEITLDSPMAIQSLEGYRCLEIMADSADFQISYGLVLCPTGRDTDTYTRVGVYTPPFPRERVRTRFWGQKAEISIV